MHRTNSQGLAMLGGCCLLLVVLTLMSGMATAQSGSASVQGLVTDSTGALMPSALVTLTSTTTGVSLTSHTDASGNYSFPTVTPGTYNIEVVKEGFGAYRVTALNVAVGQRTAQDASLSVSSNSAIEVTASGLQNLLDNESNDLGTVIGPQSVNQLPLANRNYLQLGLLSGATQAVRGGAAGSTSQTGHDDVAINIAGNQPDFTLYVANGLQTLGSRAGNTSLNLSVGAIDQFEVHYGFFMPDLGPNPGIVDVVTKSGGNKLHGELFEFVRNNQIQARDYFNVNGAGVPTKPGPYHLNQFGFDFGGPVLHDRLFYFVNYEGYRRTASNTVLATTPTAAMFSGDFSSTGTTIYDPATYNPATNQRTAFVGNRIPTARISPQIQKLLTYYTPGATLTANNVSGTPRSTYTSDQFMGKIDYSVNAHNQVFAQGNWLNSPVVSPGLFPGQGTSYPLDTELVNLGWNSTLSSNKVNVLHMGGIRDAVYSQGVTSDGIQNQLGITGTADQNGVPTISLNGYSSFGTSNGLIGNLDNIYQVQDSFNWLHSNHQIKFGADVAYLRTVQSSANANARGVFNFNGNFTAQFPNTGGYTPLANTGSSFADLLLGTLTTGQSIGMPRTHLRWTTMQPYLQDTWKITRDLTANLALAWYGATSPNAVGEDRNLMHSFDFTAGRPTFVALGQGSSSVYPMTRTNFAPRVGFAYSPNSLENTVFRAGWGIYYTTQQAVNIQYAVVSQVISVNNAVSNVQPTPSYVLGQNALPGYTVGQITQTQANAITGPIQYLSDHERSPYVEQWNADVQHTFGSKYLLDVAYIGNASHRLPLNWNPFDCSSLTTANLCFDSNNPYNGKFTYMQEVDNIGYGNYNALLVKLQRQFSNGLSLLANYTYSKALAAAQEGSNGTLNQRRSCLPGCDYGQTTSNLPHSVVVSAVWELPFGRGRHFGATLNPVADGFIGGWDIDAIVSMQSGLPFTVTAPNNTAWSPGMIRANTYCDGHAALADKNIRTNGHYWLKTQSATQTEANGACYVNPNIDPVNLVAGALPLKPGTTERARAAFGTSAFDSLRGPGINNWDMGVHKEFRIYREYKFTLRGEFFNIWNHTQFANPNAGVAAGAGNFGLISSTQHAARIIQIGGTFRF